MSVLIAILGSWLDSMGFGSPLVASGTLVLVVVNLSR